MLENWGILERMSELWGAEYWWSGLFYRLCGGGVMWI